MAGVDERERRYTGGIMCPLYTWGSHDVFLTEIVHDTDAHVVCVGRREQRDPQGVEARTQTIGRIQAQAVIFSASFVFSLMRLHSMNTPALV